MVDACLTTDELAERHRTTPAAVAMRRHRGDSPRGCRSGKRILFPLDGVEAWEADQLSTAS